MTITEVDGRRLRREQNREAVLEALVSLLVDGVYQPTSNEIAERAGISPRSLFRYFDDVDDLSRAAIERHIERTGALFTLDVAPDAPTAEKVGLVVEARTLLFDAIAPTARTARVIGHRNPVVAEQLGRIRAHLRADLRKVFAPDLSTRADVFPALDALLSFESYELLRFDQRLSRAKSVAALVTAANALLSS
jgi:AcrR family transcriptional regulator